ncbi:MAG: hypothetical protein ABI416_13795 [Ginsengibacter sp.]
MKSNKKYIVIINKFPKTLYTITETLKDENVDFIIDASDFLQPVDLLNIAHPDLLLLNLKLPSTEAIKLMGLEMQDNMYLNESMITSCLQAYYVSLCSTFYSNYKISNQQELESIPGEIAMQQLN